MTQLEYKAVLLGVRFALKTLGVDRDGLLHRFVEQEFQAWARGHTYEHALMWGSAITKTEWRGDERFKGIWTEPPSKAARPKQKARHGKKMAAPTPSLHREARATSSPRR